MNSVATINMRWGKVGSTRLCNLPINNLNLTVCQVLTEKKSLKTNSNIGERCSVVPKIETFRSNSCGVSRASHNVTKLLTKLLTRRMAVELVEEKREGRGEWQMRRWKNEREGRGEW